MELIRLATAVYLLIICVRVTKSDFLRHNPRIFQFWSFFPTLGVQKYAKNEIMKIPTHKKIPSLMKMMPKMLLLNKNDSTDHFLKIL